MVLQMQIPSRASKAIPIRAPGRELPSGLPHNVLIATPRSKVKPKQGSQDDKPDLLWSLENDLKRDLGANLNRDEESERLKATYDVYARPFIPSELRDINFIVPHETINATTNHTIAYDAYISTFSGTSFLPKCAKIPNRTRHPKLPDLLAPETYLQHLLTLSQVEQEAKKLENESYGLYKIRIFPAVVNGLQLFALSIPGLREDSPLVEMGDTIQLRQLWLNPDGSLPLCPWDMIELNAAVYSVNRAQELVYLLVDGLRPSTMIFNVIIPLKQRVIAAQLDGLAFVENQLRMLIGHIDSEGTDDKHEQLARRVASIALEEASQISQSKVQHRHLAPASNQDSITVPNDWMRRMLFPSKSDGIMQIELRSIPFQGMFDSVINYEQLQAVNSASKQDYGVLPFLISGPPGTGKTKTIVEIAMQLLQTTEVAHILIVAPSESAADTLALRLKKLLDQTQLFRLNGPWRADNEVPSELLPFCHMDGRMFCLPPFPKLMKFNVVVTSTRDASILAAARITNSDLYYIEKNMQTAFNPEASAAPKSLHWGALMMDESGQATELDALPSLRVVCPPVDYTTGHQPRFIMAGDQHQLGPRTASRHAQLTLSLFARLFERDVYSDHPLSRSNIRPSAGPPVLSAKMLPMLYPPFVNLIRNYRSHPAILSVPSQQFYNDTLIPEAPTRFTPLQHSPLWQGRKWPVLFVPHTGPDDIERDGGGWYNHSEASLACNIAQYLVSSAGVHQKEIVVMSPFAAQVKLLRAIIRSNKYGGGSGLWEVNIGPLEAYQGLESRVVIICTTRTRAKYVEPDIRRGLGIIGQKRRMNVALTRAKEGLVVIGSPAVLSTDEHWRRWMAFCGRNGLVNGDAGNLGTKEEDHKGVGVLEKALVARDDIKKDSMAKVLGAASAQEEDEMWVAGLEAALGEYEDGEDGEDDEYENGEAGEEKEGAVEGYEDDDSKST